eukprot:TRINITY_DN8287_c0_g2_i3.p3 TRINITY_DN8287_c0_g2~~TRINITY_DN8287_c0_g2_i3.p3  ORF type:complete len:147 (+),score=55.17 TRINITY_DN8287_c0_g2_i3:73-513(+)
MCIRDRYQRRVHGTRHSTFERAETWISEIEKCSAPLKLLIGNKIDQANEKKGEQVTKAEAVGLARKHGMEYVEACSVGEASLMQVFEQMLGGVVGMIPEPLTIEGLMDKGIVLGKKVTQNPKMKILLAENYLKEKAAANEAKHYDA